MHAMKTWGSGGTVPCSLILRTTWGHVVNVVPWLLYHQCKNPWYPLHRRHHDLHTWSAPRNQMIIPQSCSPYLSNMCAIYTNLDNQVSSWTFHLCLGLPMSHCSLGCYWRDILSSELVSFVSGDVTSFSGVLSNLLCCLFSVCVECYSSFGSPTL